MKTILSALAGLILTATTVSNGNAAEAKTNRYVLASKAVSQSYNCIEVRGNVDIILVQGTSNLMTLEGYQSQLENVTLNVHGNTLYVNTTGKEKGKNPVVYIPVNDLRFLTVRGNSNVKTLGFLQATNTVIELEAACHVELKSTGKISIAEYSSNEYVVEKWEMASL
ncbi:MAG: DUF2807 domain-containing protein [Chitinophagaceae bacterium]